MSQKDVVAREVSVYIKPGEEPQKGLGGTGG